MTINSNRLLAIVALMIGPMFALDTEAVADTKEVRTATFFIDAKDMISDFAIEAIDGDATISFARVIKQ